MVLGSHPLGFAPTSPRHGGGNAHLSKKRLSDLHCFWTEPKLIRAVYDTLKCTQRAKRGQWRVGVLGADTDDGVDNQRIIFMLRVQISTKVLVTLAAPRCDGPSFHSDHAND